jgi:hypothetical protein
VEVPPAPSTYIKVPFSPWLIDPSLQSSPLWLGSLVWSCARKLEETPCAGRHHAAGFPVRVLLPQIATTKARMMYIHHTCVIPLRCYTFGTPLCRLVRLHDLEVGFDGLHHQCLCGNVFPAFGLQRYEHRRCFVTLQLHRIDHGEKVCRIFFCFLLRTPTVVSEPTYA